MRGTSGDVTPSAGSDRPAGRASERAANSPGGAGAPVRLQRITLREIGLPLRRPFRISSGEVHQRRILLLELEDGDGTRGWSECVAPERPNYCPETVDTAWHAIREWLAPRVLGAIFAGPGDVWPALGHGVRGHRMARAAVEMGCWELDARRRGVALARLLGGERERVETGISLGVQDSPEALARRAEAARAEGYRRIKVKIKPGADVSYVAAAREAVGEDTTLMADANAAYGLEDAERLAELDRFGLLMLEQPLAPGALLPHARLQERLETPICLDESVTSPEVASDMVELGAGRIINIKPGRVGGFAQAVSIHDLAERAGMPVWCGGMLESGVGRAHNVALASLPNFRLPGDLSASRRYWERDIVEPEWTVDAESRVRVPLDRPGMGVEVDRDRVEDLTVRREDIVAD